MQSEPKANTEDPELSEGSDLVVWSNSDLVGLFVDALDRGDPPASKIVGFTRQNDKLRAIIRNVITGQTRVYEMDMATRRPFPVRMLWRLK